MVQLGRTKDGTHIPNQNIGGPIIDWWKFLIRAKIIPPLRLNRAVQSPNLACAQICWHLAIVITSCSLEHLWFFNSREPWCQSKFNMEVTCVPQPTTNTGRPYLLLECKSCNPTSIAVLTCNLMWKEFFILCQGTALALPAPGASSPASSGSQPICGHEGDESIVLVIYVIFCPALATLVPLRTLHYLCQYLSA